MVFVWEVVVVVYVGIVKGGVIFVEVGGGSGDVY